MNKTKFKALLFLLFSFSLFGQMEINAQYPWMEIVDCGALTGQYAYDLGNGFNPLIAQCTEPQFLDDFGAYGISVRFDYFSYAGEIQQLPGCVAIPAFFFRVAVYRKKDVQSISYDPFQITFMPGPFGADPRPVRTGNWSNRLDNRGAVCPERISDLRRSHAIITNLPDGEYVAVVQRVWQSTIAQFGGNLENCGACGCTFDLGIPLQDVTHIDGGPFTYVTSIDDTDVDFSFLASNTVETINDDPILDGKVERSETLPGPELGPFTTGVDAQVSGTYLEEITYLIEETDCISGGDGTVIYENTVPAPLNMQPENFFFIDEVLDPVTGDPFFIIPENTEGKCFKLTVTLTNPCGEKSAYSYFTITDECYYCFTNPQTGTEAEARGNTSQDRAGHSPPSLLPTPNPSATGLFQLRIDRPMRLEIFNGSGQRIKSLELEDSSGGFTLDLSSAPSGLYWYRWKTVDGYSGSGKLIKQ